MFYQLFSYKTKNNICHQILTNRLTSIKIKYFEIWVKSRTFVVQLGVCTQMSTYTASVVGLYPTTLTIGSTILFQVVLQVSLLCRRLIAVLTNHGSMHRIGYQY